SCFFFQPLHLIGTKRRVVPLDFFALFDSSGEAPPTLWPLSVHSNSETRRAPACVGSEEDAVTNRDGGKTNESLCRTEEGEERTRLGAFDWYAYSRGAEEAARGRTSREKLRDEVAPFPQTSYHTVVQAVRACIDRSLLPALVFCFSRRQCLAIAERLLPLIGILTPLIARHQLGCMYTAAEAGVSGWPRRGSLLGTFREEEDAESFIPPEGEEELRRRENADAQRQLETLKPLFLRGIGVHHAGLLPPVKELVEKAFERGLLRVTVCTETFSVGVNLPAKAVIFSSLFKPVDSTAAEGSRRLGIARPASSSCLASEESLLLEDAWFCASPKETEGEEAPWMRRDWGAGDRRSLWGGDGETGDRGDIAWRLLSRAEFEQMAGRAGRRGVDQKGTVILLLPSPAPPPASIETLFFSPTASLSSCGLPTESLHSQLNISFQTLLLLLSRNNPERTTDEEEEKTEEREEKEEHERKQGIEEETGEQNREEEEADGEQRNAEERVSRVRHEEANEEFARRRRNFKKARPFSCGRVVNDLLLSSFRFFSISMNLPFVQRETELQKRWLRALPSAFSLRPGRAKGDRESAGRRARRGDRRDTEGEETDRGSDAYSGDEGGENVERNKERRTGDTESPNISASSSSLARWKKQAARCMRLVEKYRHYRWKLHRSLQAAFSDSYLAYLHPGAVVLLVETVDARPFERRRRFRGEREDKASPLQFPTSQWASASEEDAHGGASLALLRDAPARIALLSQGSVSGSSLSEGSPQGVPLSSPLSFGGQKERRGAAAYLSCFTEKAEARRRCWGWGLILGVTPLKKSSAGSDRHPQGKKQRTQVFLDCLVACVFTRRLGSTKFPLTPQPFRPRAASACKEGGGDEEGDRQERWIRRLVPELVPGETKQMAEEEVERCTEWVVAAAEEATKLWAERLGRRDLERKKRRREKKREEEREEKRADEAVELAVFPFSTECVQAISQVHVNLRSHPTLDLRKEEDRVALFVSMAEALRTACSSSSSSSSASAWSSSPFTSSASQGTAAEAGEERADSRGREENGRGRTQERRKREECGCGVLGLHEGETGVPFIPLLETARTDACVHLLHRKLRSAKEKLEQATRAAFRKQEKHPSQQENRSRLLKTAFPSRTSLSSDVPIVAFLSGRLCELVSARRCLRRFCEFVFLSSRVLPRLERLRALAPTADFERVRSMEAALLSLNFLRVQENFSRRTLFRTKGSASPFLHTTRKGLLAGYLFFFEERSLVTAEILDCMHRRLSSRLLADGRELSSLSRSRGDAFGPGRPCSSRKGGDARLGEEGEEEGEKERRSERRSAETEPERTTEGLAGVSPEGTGGGRARGTWAEFQKPEREEEKEEAKGTSFFLPDCVDEALLLTLFAGLCGDGRERVAVVDESDSWKAERSACGELRGAEKKNALVGKHTETQEAILEEAHDMDIASKIIQARTTEAKASGQPKSRQTTDGDKGIQRHGTRDRENSQRKRANENTGRQTKRDRRKRDRRKRDRAEMSDGYRKREVTKRQRDNERDISGRCRFGVNAAVPIVAALRRQRAGRSVVEKVAFVDRQAMRDVYRWTKRQAVGEKEGGADLAHPISFTLRRLASALQEIQAALLHAYGRDPAAEMLSQLLRNLLLLGKQGPNNYILPT
ncbi:DEAD/DEAH box helicase domain-containing protein, partial [Toxoplasma gondii TgCatPRC2]